MSNGFIQKMCQNSEKFNIKMIIRNKFSVTFLSHLIHAALLSSNKSNLYLLISFRDSVKYGFLASSLSSDHSLEHNDCHSRYVWLTSRGTFSLASRRYSRNGDIARFGRPRSRTRLRSADLTRPSLIFSFSSWICRRCSSDIVASYLARFCR